MTVTTRRATTADPRGTKFAPETGSPFTVREGRTDYEPLGDFLDRSEGRKLNRKALHLIALEVLSEARLDDPNVCYARAVLDSIVQSMWDAGRMETQEADDLRAAFDEGVEHAGHAVAAAWLRERRSIPLPDAN